VADPTGRPTVTVCNAQGAHSISTAEWTSPPSSPRSNISRSTAICSAPQTGAAGHRPARITLPSTTIINPQYPAILQEELHGKRVLIVGYGDIGKTIEKYLIPFGVRSPGLPAARAPVARGASGGALDSLLPNAEIVILILPHTPESHGLIGAKQLALMAQGALLVNAARGPIVQTDALVDALNSGRIRAALDVTDPEPLPPEHPLWKCPNLLITPHVAGSTPQFSQRAIRIAADQVRRMLRASR
jgi:phosphoglycerate dehydrogenase-like enzyme